MHIAVDWPNHSPKILGVEVLVIGGWKTTCFRRRWPGLKIAALAVAEQLALHVHLRAMVPSEHDRVQGCCYHRHRHKPVAVY